jgi:hypothetical protein
MAARQTHRVRVSAFTNPGIAQGIPAVTSETRDPFQEALDTFKSKLTAADRRNFSIASRQQLEEALDKIQSDQHTGRKLKNMNRLSAFLEGMETFGKVINVYCQASEIVAFLWVRIAFQGLYPNLRAQVDEHSVLQGPVKLVLLVAKSLSDVFQMLLDIYEELGKTLKLYAQGECLFPKDTNMADLLADAYKVVLEFHYCTLRYFRKPCKSLMDDQKYQGLNL